MRCLSLPKLSAALLVFSGIAAALPVQAQKLYVAVNNGDIRQVSPANGANFGTFVPYDARNYVYAPTYLNFDPNGNLLVVNAPNVGISKFSPTGTFLESFGAHTPARYSAVAGDALGNVYAANTSTHTIDKFSPTGASLGVFADASKGITTPLGLTLDKDGNVYVSNSQESKTAGAYTNSITKYAPDGTSLGVFTTPTTDYQAQSIAFNNAGNLLVGGFNPYGRAGTILAFSSTGASLGKAIHNFGIYDPLQFAFDASDNIFVDDNGSVLEYNSAGTIVNPHLNIDASVTGLAFAPIAAAVPEASTTVSLSLLLAFGLGGMIVSRRKRSIQ